MSNSKRRVWEPGDLLIGVYLLHQASEKMVYMEANLYRGWRGGQRHYTEKQTRMAWNTELEVVI